MAMGKPSRFIDITSGEDAGAVVPSATYGGGDEGNVPGKYRGTKGAGAASTITGCPVRPNPPSSSPSSPKSP